MAEHSNEPLAMSLKNTVNELARRVEILEAERDSRNQSIASIEHGIVELYKKISLIASSMNEITSKHIPQIVKENKVLEILSPITTCTDDSTNAPFSPSEPTPPLSEDILRQLLQLHESLHPKDSSPSLPKDSLAPQPRKTPFSFPGEASPSYLHPRRSTSYISRGQDEGDCRKKRNPGVKNPKATQSCCEGIPSFYRQPHSRPTGESRLGSESPPMRLRHYRCETCGILEQRRLESLKNAEVEKKEVKKVSRDKNRNDPVMINKLNNFAYHPPVVRGVQSRRGVRRGEEKSGNWRTGSQGMERRMERESRMREEREKMEGEEERRFTRRGNMENERERDGMEKETEEMMGRGELRGRGEVRGRGEKRRGEERRGERRDRSIKIEVGIRLEGQGEEEMEGESLLMMKVSPPSEESLGERESSDSPSTNAFFDSVVLDGKMLSVRDSFPHQRRRMEKMERPSPRRKHQSADLNCFDEEERELKQMTRQKHSSVDLDVSVKRRKSREQMCRMYNYHYFINNNKFHPLGEKREKREREKREKREKRESEMKRDMMDSVAVDKKSAVEFFFPEFECLSERVDDLNQGNITPVHSQKDGSIDVLSKHLIENK